MNRLLEIAAFVLLSFCLTGCNGSSEDKPIWEELKIGDLASPSGDRGRIEPLKTINFNVYVLEMSAAEVSRLEDVWQTLYTEPFQFEGDGAFDRNLFSVAFGHGPMWKRVTDLLYSAGARKAQTVSLLLPPGQTNDIAVARLIGEQTIFYITADGSTEGVAVGPGRLALRLKAEKVPGVKGICDVTARPVYAPPFTGAIPSLRSPTASGGHSFKSAGFKLKMAPGDFFLLGPQKHIEEHTMLGSWLFSRPAPSPGVRMFVTADSEDQNPQPYFGPVVRTYLVVCTGIHD